MNEVGDRDFRTNCPRPPHFHALFTASSTAKVLSHSDVLEISQICTSCIRPAHESCRPETERLHVQSSVPIVSKLSLGGCTLVAVNKRDVHRVEQATFGRQATVCMVWNSFLHAFTWSSTFACPFVLVLCVAGGACSCCKRSFSMHVIIMPLRSYVCRPESNF